MSNPDPPQNAAPESVFEELCAQELPSALALVRRRLGKLLRRRLDSQDVLQEAMLEAARLFAQGRAQAKEGLPHEKGEFRAWLAAIIELKVKNLARFHVTTEKRSLKREVPLEPALASPDSPAETRTPSALLADAEQRERIERALEKLSPKQREVIDLVHFQKLKVQEAAARMGKTPNATSVLLFAALNRLGGIIQPDPSAGHERPSRPKARRKDDAPSASSADADDGEDPPW